MTNKKGNKQKLLKNVIVGVQMEFFGKNSKQDNVFKDSSLNELRKEKLLMKSSSLSLSSLSILDVHCCCCCCQFHSHLHSHSY